MLLCVFQIFTILYYDMLDHTLFDYAFEIYYTYKCVIFFLYFIVHRVFELIK